MHQLFFPVIVLLMLAACPQPPQQDFAAPDASGARITGEIVYAGGQLSYRLDDRELWSEVTDAVPYKIVSRAEPPLVTAVGPDLVPVTWAAVPEPVPYHSMLPAYAVPPLTALVRMPSEQARDTKSLLLLDGKGKTVLESEHGQLLLTPGQTDLDTCYLVLANDGDAIVPYSGDPVLRAVESASGAAIWEQPLDPRFDLADVWLWALTDTHGLISLHYSYLDCEFASFDLSTGEIVHRWDLVGQPYLTGRYPGGLVEQSDVAINPDGTVSLVIFQPGQHPELWDFNLATGTVNTALLGEDYQRAWTEDNPHPAGGAGVPAPPKHPFPQGLIPTEPSSDWRIPALIDEAGNLLVIDGAGARWVSIGG